MINELFIKIPGYKTLQHFSLSACPFALFCSWQSIKHFMCEKYGNGWKTAKILQLNFYFMPCCSSGMKIFVSGFAKRPPVRMFWGYHVKKVCCRREKKNPLSLFCIDFPLLFHSPIQRGRKNELFSLHGIKSIW